MLTLDGDDGYLHPQSTLIRVDLQPTHQSSKHKEDYRDHTNRTLLFPTQVSPRTNSVGADAGRSRYGHTCAGADLRRPCLQCAGQCSDAGSRTAISLRYRLSHATD